MNMGTPLGKALITRIENDSSSISRKCRRAVSLYPMFASNGSVIGAAPRDCCHNRSEAHIRLLHNVEWMKCDLLDLVEFSW